MDFAFEPQVTLRTCSAEDLIVMKAFAGRDQDWLDFEGIVLRQASRLDGGAILREIEPLLELKEDRDTATRLEAMLASS